MSAVLYRYMCNSCGTSFDASGVPEMSYGEFILRSESSEEVFLEAITNQAFNDVCKIVDDYMANSNIDPNSSEDIVQKVFGSICDYGEKGEQFHIGLMPVCPNCLSRDMASWKMINPVQLSKIENATQTKWASLNDAQRKALIYEKIRICSAQKPI
ncbi:MAG: hypothetical protein ABJH45_02955 [Paracoccaceae bacterium]